METDEFEYKEFKVEASTSNDFEHGEDEFGFGSKCGSIFISNIGKYTFICEFCKRYYENMEHFSIHLLESKHLKCCEADELIAEFVTYDDLSETKIVIEKCEFKPITFSGTTTNEISAADKTKESSSPKSEEIIEFVDVNEVNVWNFSRPKVKPSVPVSVSTVLPNSEMKFYCKNCDLAFKGENAYSDHIKWHEEMKQHDRGQLNEDRSAESTANNTDQQSTERVRSISLKSADTNANVYCEMCDRKFLDTMSIKFHAEKMHPDTIPQVLMADPLYRKCKYCRQPFEKISDRIKHENSHKEEKKYSCSYCSKRFTSKNIRENHENLHKGIEPLQCPHCPATYASSSKRRVHIREEHLGIKFACEQCGKTFPTKTHLLTHLRVHTKELPFQCEECGRRFRFLFDFNSHRKRHENKREYKCEICEKAFNLRIHLVDHMINHSDERPYSCDVCGLSFRRPSTMRTHKKRHSNIKEYECNLCGKKFAQSATLFCHKRTHAK